MVKVELVNDVLRVTGLPNGGEWLQYVPNPGYLDQYGVIDDQMVWLFDGKFRLNIFNIESEEKYIIDCATDKTDESGYGVSVKINNDHTKFFIVMMEDKEQALTVIDIGLKKITARFTQLGIPPSVRSIVFEKNNGIILVSALTKRDGINKVGFFQIVIATGLIEEDFVLLEGLNCHGLRFPSPSGKFWLRSDDAHLPHLDIRPGMLTFRPWEKPQRLYGLSLQVWTSKPLRFSHRLVVRWLPVEELPFGQFYDSDVDKRNENVRFAYDALSEALARSNISPTGRAVRSVFSPEIQTNDTIWKHLNDLYMKFNGDILSDIRWQSDEDAIWVRLSDEWSCCGLDGQSSAPLKIQREIDNMHNLVPLPNRQAILTSSKWHEYSGDNYLDGSPSNKPFFRLIILTDQDRYTPSMIDRKSESSDLHKRIDLIKRNFRTLRISLKSLDESDCVVAINDLEKIFANDFLLKVVDSELNIFFNYDDKDITSMSFFKHVADNCYNSGPSIQRLIETYLINNPSNCYFFECGERGEGLLCYAAMALGLLDINSLSTLKLYGSILDKEHEYWFALNTLPAIVYKHGWTDSVLNFTIWVMQCNFYNSLQDYNIIWKNWGMRDAVVSRYSPDDFAKRVRQVIETSGYEWDDFDRAAAAPPTSLSDVHALKRGEFMPGTEHWGTPHGTIFPMTDKLERDIPGPHEPWLRSFFAHLRCPRITPQPKPFGVWNASSGSAPQVGPWGKKPD